jgi:hypothetical protein
VQEHTIKAVVYDRCSSVDVLQRPEIDQPVDGDDQVLVRVRDWAAASGHPPLEVSQLWDDRGRE